MSRKLRVSYPGGISQGHEMRRPLVLINQEETMHEKRHNLWVDPFAR